MTDSRQHGPAAETTQPDLASRWLGGSVIAASDESFGEKENLLTPTAAAFEPGHYSHRGEIVDGWETKRRREPGHDWALIRLGAPGVLTSVEVDTSFFTGNHPESCLVEACGREGYPSPAELADPAGWTVIVPRSPLAGDTSNAFGVTDPCRYTHLRLSIFPDGGVARLRAHGQVVPDPRQLDGLTIDLASQRHGGAVVTSSDDFYTSARLLNRPDTARSMGEGWETRRRRDGGPDHVVIRLAFPGHIRQLIVDTAHFKYNASAEIAVQACGEVPAAGGVRAAGQARAAGAEPAPPAGSPDWVPLLGRTRLQPDTRHVLAVPPAGHCQPVAAIRLDAFPDGGISRVRVIGCVSPAARRQAGYRWLNSLPAGQALRCLTDAGLPADLAAAVTGQRPLASHWLDGLREGPSGTGTAGAPAEVIRILAAMLAGLPAGSPA